MVAKETKLKGCFVLEPKVFDDGRGYFFENYNARVFNELIGKEVNFVQDNESFSTKGVLRGLHFQKGKFAQAKLVRVIQGEVLDVAVDLREDSPTFLQYEAVLLSNENKKQLFIPRGFAHGFLVLSETAIFSYKCDNFYKKEAEEGIIYNDPKLNIDWLMDDEDIMLSEKDKLLSPVEKLFQI